MATNPRAAAVSVRATVESQLRRIAAEQGRPLEPLTDELKLLESGLDSLALAVVVMRLGDSLGIEPFNCGNVIEFPITLREFVRMYEASMQGPSRD